MEDVLLFLKNLLTDRVDNIKEEALELYVKLSTKVDNVLILHIPNDDPCKLYIKPMDLQKAKEEFEAGRKISAIKHVRCYGWLDGQVNDRPGLKQAKEFVENQGWSEVNTWVRNQSIGPEGF